MKIGGRSISGPKKQTVVIPREEGDVVFHFVAVTDDKEFDRLYPEPQPQITFNVKLQKNIPNVDDPNYKQQLVARALARRAWHFMESAKPSNIEWELVKLNDPSTWHLWHDDLKAAGFSIQECNAIYEGFAKANILTEEMLDEARKRFLALAEPGVSQTSSSPTTEPSIIPTGEPVNASASAPPG